MQYTNTSPSIVINYLILLSMESVCFFTAFVLCNIMQHRSVILTLVTLVFKAVLSNDTNFHLQIDIVRHQNDKETNPWFWTKIALFGPFCIFGFGADFPRLFRKRPIRGRFKQWPKVTVPDAEPAEESASKIKKRKTRKCWGASEKPPYKKSKMDGLAIVFSFFSERLENNHIFISMR